MPKVGKGVKKAIRFGDSTRKNKFLGTSRVPDRNKKGYDSIREGIGMLNAMLEDLESGKSSKSTFNGQFQNLIMITAKQVKRKPRSSLARNWPQFTAKARAVQERYAKLTGKDKDEMVTITDDYFRDYIKKVDT